MRTVSDPLIHPMSLVRSMLQQNEVGMQKRNRFYVKQDKKTAIGLDA